MRLRTRSERRGRETRAERGPAPSAGFADSNLMKQLTIVVRPFKAEAVLKAINELDVIACSVQEAKGYSRQKGYLDRYLGSEYSMAFLPKVEISVWVSDQRAGEVADHLVKTARTGASATARSLSWKRAGRGRWSFNALASRERQRPVLGGATPVADARGSPFL